MKILKTLLLVIIPTITWASYCDDTYYLQSATQSIYSGSDPKNLAEAKRSTVRADLSGLEVLNNSMTYNVLTKFEGACTKAAKPVTFKTRSSSKPSFRDSIDPGYKVQMFDTNTRVTGFTYDYWFGFFKPDSNLKIVLGRYNSESEMFRSWYLAILYTDSTRDPTSHLWTSQTTYYSLVGPEDSIVLERQVLDQTIRKLTMDDNHKGYFQVQFLKATYDAKQPSAVTHAKKPISSFHVNQTGNLVLIQPGENQAASGEPLTVYGMMGNKIVTLHPTGYLYQWNGRTASGAEAPTGVYFVQSGNRILGKFFYTRQ